MPIIDGMWYGAADMARLRERIREWREDRRALIDPARGWPPVHIGGAYSCLACRGEVEPWSIFPAGGRSFCACNVPTILDRERSYNEQVDDGVAEWIKRHDMHSGGFGGL